ncbi:conserved hypothetical protein [Rhodobacteraceae bacterium HTCC2083]|jgi:hypothetical protein|nr:conserved hypothetical protein [Rhodobacteraceae bacterium HTCC2083]
MTARAITRCLPILALTRFMVATGTIIFIWENDLQQPAAMVGSWDLALADILDQMKPYLITSQVEYARCNESVFEAELGAENFVDLPLAVQEFHRQDAPPVWSGLVEVERGTSMFAKIIATVFGFPQTGSDVPLAVTVDRMLDRAGQSQERWTRSFD